MAFAVLVDQILKKKQTD
jgi:hypothetical protein